MKQSLDNLELKAGFRIRIPSLDPDPDWNWINIQALENEAAHITV